MNREEIRRTIDGNLRNAGIGETDIRVQPDPFGGWRIAVVTDGFAGKRLSERKRLTLQGLKDLPIEWLDLLTGAEREWAGTLPLDTELEELPLWPEALARGEHIPEDVIFASDLDEDLPRPLIVSFYSLRGVLGARRRWLTQHGYWQRRVERLSAWTWIWRRRGLQGCLGATRMLESIKA